MTTFQNVTQQVNLNNAVIAIALWNSGYVTGNPGVQTGINATFPAVILIPNPNPYWGAGGVIANRRVGWSGPVGNHVTLSDLGPLPLAGAADSATAEPNTAPTNFTAGKWSDADTATLREGADALRKALDDRDAGFSDEIRSGIHKVLDAVDEELAKR
ncbi:hypothetical protein PFICI_13870 [Pestalotiopsis fici W106-1]|uniref:Uncharacterized protein n=1 Tax=Pestalotiopsis fici (strain W106-1 / CGMCC3.15140) TaxID=1229662 RepID=W3WJQ6_PESFW|nr:uncharacterized protein PFICI_13870 [Pestalotiopsis fici W106-1]ETS74004.1 hypothetical protein PFICI_13870 [Pestalotiopsis fici W106-1]